MKLIKIFIILLVTVHTSFAQITPEQFISDIDQLQELITTKHVKPYWITSENDFKAQVERSKEIISKKEDCDESCYVELFRIIAAINDGHSSISGGSRYDLFGYLPFSARWFSDGLYIVKAAESYKQILGHRITEINGMEINEVLKHLESVVPHANESRFKKFAGSYLHLPGLLYGLGITSEPNEALFTFSDGDSSFQVNIRNMPPEEEESAVFISYLNDKDNLPLYQKNNDSYYWFEYDEKNELMYFQYNRVGNMKSESSSKFAERLWSAVDSLEINKFVLDLRYNGGGSFPYSLNYVQGILDRVDLSRRGTFFVITGYDTFSAAILMLNQLELRSQAIIVGEQPCDYPASPGDSERYVLSNTQLKVNLSALFHPTIFEEDARTSTLLDKEIEMSWKDYENGVDPVIKYILDYSENTIKTVPSADFTGHLGKYSYSKTRNMQLTDRDGKLWIEIDNALESPLYFSSEKTFQTEVVGLSVALEEDTIRLNFPDGTSKSYEKIDNNLSSAIDLIYSNDFENAERTYTDIKSMHPDFIELKDHQMSFLASIAYFELMKYSRTNASEIAKKILNLGIQLNDGDAPFCEFSLRFY